MLTHCSSIYQVLYVCIYIGICICVRVCIYMCMFVYIHKNKHQVACTPYPFRISYGFPAIQVLHGFFILPRWEIDVILILISLFQKCILVQLMITFPLHPTLYNSCSWYSLYLVLSYSPVNNKIIRGAVLTLSFFGGGGWGCFIECPVHAIFS